MKSKKCKYKGCTNPVWSGGLCKNHIARKPMKKRREPKEHSDLINKVIKKEMMHKFFLSIWQERKHRSEISKVYLGKEPLSVFFHHILPKKKYFQAAFDPENIILLTPDEHNNVENDMYKYEEVNKRRKQLLRKYNLI
jgi:hypothetical protein